jgi:hypothetical protein
MDTKNQGRNDRFELDMCWCGFRMNMSDDAMTARAHTYHYMIKWKVCSAYTACDEMALEMNKWQEVGKRREKENSNESPN